MIDGTVPKVAGRKNPDVLLTLGNVWKVLEHVVLKVLEMCLERAEMLKMLWKKRSTSRTSSWRIKEMQDSTTKTCDRTWFTL